MNDDLQQWVILFREPDGRVVTLTEDDPEDPTCVRTILFDDYDVAIREGARVSRDQQRPTSVVEAPAHELFNG